MKKLLKSIFKTLGYLLLLLVIIIAVLEIWRFFPSKDISESEIGDETLMQYYTDLDIAEEDNGIYQLTSIDFKDPYDEFYFNSDKKANAELEKILKDNQEALNLYAAASTKKYIIDPAALSYKNLSFDTEVKTLNNLFKLNHFQAYMSENVYEKDRNTDHYTQSFSITSKIYANRNSLLNIIVGITIDDLNNKSLWQFINKKNVNSNQLLTLSKSVLQTQDSSNGLAKKNI